MSVTIENPNQLIKLRPLGNLEHYCSTWNHMKFYFNVSQTATYTSPPSHLSTETQIFTALACVIAIHPSLSCIPIGEDTSSPYFARLPEIDLRQILTVIPRKKDFDGFAAEQDEELDELLEQQHNIPFSGTTTPYWRLIILQDLENEMAFTASFIYHHAIADGTSGVIFHRNLLDALNSPRLPYITRETASIRSPISPLLPPIEDLINLRPSLRFLAKTWWKGAVASPSKKLWTGSKILPPARTNFRSLYFPRDVTEQLVEVCRFRHTTVQAVLQCFIATLLFELLPEEVEKLKVIIPVSLRRWCGPAVRAEMGTWISSTETVFKRKEVMFSWRWKLVPWEQVRWGREAIDLYLRTMGRDDNLGLLKYVRDFEGFCRAAAGTEREGSLEVSNVGRFDLAASESHEEGRWEVGRMAFSQSAGVMSSAVMVTAVTGGDGGLTLGFCWQDNVVEREVVEKLMAAVKALIQQEFHPPPPPEPRHPSLNYSFHGTPLTGDPSDEDRRVDDDGWS